jgi:hypothetical protein
MVSCPEIMENSFNLTNFDTYMCPNNTLFQIEGGLESRRGTRKTMTFGWKVLPCPAMNTIRD